MPCLHGKKVVVPMFDDEDFEFETFEKFSTKGKLPSVKPRRDLKKGLEVQMAKRAKAKAKEEVLKEIELENI